MVQYGYNELQQTFFFSEIQNYQNENLYDTGVYKYKKPP